MAEKGFVGNTVLDMSLRCGWSLWQILMFGLPAQTENIRDMSDESDGMSSQIEAIDSNDAAEVLSSQSRPSHCSSWKLSQQCETQSRTRFLQKSNR